MGFSDRMFRRIAMPDLTREMSPLRALLAPSSSCEGGVEMCQ